MSVFALCQNSRQLQELFASRRCVCVVLETVTLVFNFSTIFEESVFLRLVQELSLGNCSSTKVFIAVTFLAHWPFEHFEM